MSKSIIKIIIGTALMVGGIFGARLACDGAREIGKLGELKLAPPVKNTVYYDVGTEVYTASSLNSRFDTCLKTNEEQGRHYTVKHIFVDGELMGPSFWDRLKENEEQCQPLKR